MVFKFLGKSKDSVHIWAKGYKRVFDRMSTGVMLQFTVGVAGIHGFDS